jgi:hypothetical protein
MTVTGSPQQSEADTAHLMAGRGGRLGLEQRWAVPGTVTRQIRYASGFAGAAGALDYLADDGGKGRDVAGG